MMTQAAKPTVGIYFRVTHDFRARLEAGRVAGYRDRLHQAPSLQEYLVALLEPHLPARPVVAGEQQEMFAVSADKADERTATERFVAGEGVPVEDFLKQGSFPAWAVRKPHLDKSPTGVKGEPTQKKSKAKVKAKKKGKRK